MKGDLKPSVGRAICLRLMAFGISVLSFVLAVICVLGTVAVLAVTTRGNKATRIPQVSKPSHPQGGEQRGKTTGSEGGRATDQYSGASEGGSLGWLGRPGSLPIPSDPFAYLVENLLGRSSSIPGQYNTAEKCLAAGISREQLNRPIGIIWWDGLEKNIHPAGKPGSRATNGPTYNVLYWDPDSGSAPLNAYSQEATVLTLASTPLIPKLVAAGADPNLRFGENGDTALFDAARRSDLARIKTLLACGARQDIANAKADKEYAKDVFPIPQEGDASAYDEATRLLDFTH